MRVLLLAVAGLLAGPTALADPPEVLVAQARSQTLSDPIQALGSLRANESADLTAVASGTIESIRFQDGQRVSAGDVLVVIRSSEQRAELAQAEAELDEARRQLQRVQALAEQRQEARAVVDQRQREASTAQARMRAVQARIADRLVTAPFDGLLGLRQVSVGALLSPGTVVTTLVDDSVMKLDFGVPEVFLPLVELGLALDAVSRAFPGERFQGTVTGVDNTIDPVSRAFQVRAEIPNPDGRLRAGLLMSVRLDSREREAVVVPEEAIHSRGRQHHVLVVPDGDEGELARRAVELGTRHDGRVEILDGLSAGERVVVHGGLRLGDGDRVRVRAEIEGDEDLAEILANGRER
ncbi:MAG: efflux RND transporter periplasmic adaptor subunit [Lysobacteraceae bacterium]